MKSDLIQAKTLLVIGNGFDKRCGLASLFGEYYEKTCLNRITEFAKLISNDDIEHLPDYFKSYPDSNIWELLLYYQFYTDSEFSFEFLDNANNWCDIETLIKYVFTQKFVNGQSLLGYLLQATQLKSVNANFRSSQYHAWATNPIITFIRYQNPDVSNPTDYLRVELEKFESSLSGYLLIQVSGNKDYEAKKRRLIEKICFGRNGCEAINFNYTDIDPNGEFLLNENHIHGRLGEKIIIGIDYSNIKNAHSTDINIDAFTKTWRKLHNQQENNILSSSIYEVIFYGHSLGEQDFSYFHSIFDIYNLEKGNLKLRFLYSDYKDNEIENEEIHIKYVNNIYKLINTYAEQSGVSKNILHKLIMENRLSIEKFN